VTSGTSEAIRSSAARAVAVGAAVALAYVALAVVSGHLSPFARRPLLDGFGQPQPYRWVSPPPALASGNKRPASVSTAIHIDPHSGSQADVVSTSDVQASLALGPGTFPPKGAATDVRVTVKPLAPGGFGSAGGGRTLFGNVYRIQATYVPGGAKVSRLAGPGQLTLFYPAAPDNLLRRHVVLESIDGHTWKALPSDDFQGAQQASAQVTSLGYFAVGQSATGSKASAASKGRLVYYLILGVLVGGAVAALVVAEVRIRRSRRPPATTHRPQPPTRRRPRR
jgi:hypothetical protein